MQIADYWLDAFSQAILLSENGLVVRLNEAATRLWGVSQERAVGRPVLEIVRRHALERLMENGGELEIELGERILRFSVVHTESAQSALVAEDITYIRTREADLRESAAVLSHEFRTPVAALLGILEALEYEMPPELAQSFIRQGLQETERLSRLVEDLAVGFRPTRARTLELSETFLRVERLLSAELHNHGSELVFGESYWVRADPDKLLQVMLNLIENALKYGPQGRCIHIETQSKGDWIEVSVLDDGDPLADAENLFVAHMRGSRALGKGSGMGLYIVLSIVQGWGGRVWLERRNNKNAFCFTLQVVACS